ncbi:hypothetical protein [Photobacterium leiognathi]|uniref:Uncharacterized protein n=1 Tax=Photobacterium leiognathi subsp. mandapamensis TaxID=48408 RepID=A0A2T3KZC4_PHOLD|nr:hypothetical protein [Photobacterium leiognathi]PSV13465.1 hypothetical protein C0W93_00530 [Photobacterium leiognathi subsp. mandapamensis]
MFKAIFELGKTVVSLVGGIFSLILTLCQIFANLYRANKIEKDTNQEIDRLMREIELAERKRSLENRLKDHNK